MRTAVRGAQSGAWEYGAEKVAIPPGEENGSGEPAWDYEQRRGRDQDGSLGRDGGLSSFESALREESLEQCRVARGADDDPLAARVHAERLVDTFGP